MTPARLVAALAPALALLAAASLACAAPPLWRVTGPGGGAVTLFGSVHLLSADVSWRTPALGAALADARALWFEVPQTAGAQADVVREITARGAAPADQPLSSLLGPVDRQRLAALEAAVGASPATVERMRPWLAEVLLSLAWLQKHGASGDLGVEHVLDASAPATLERGAFETADAQVALFADAPLKQQVDDLSETLREIEADPGAFDRLERAWAAGDVAALEREELAPFKRQSPDAYRRILVERNRRFAVAVAGMVREGQHVLAVVGAGHLIGPDGVPALLRARGLAVQGP